MMAIRAYVAALSRLHKQQSPASTPQHTYTLPHTHKPNPLPRALLDTCAFAGCVLQDLGATEQHVALVLQGRARVSFMI